MLLEMGALGYKPRQWVPEFTPTQHKPCPLPLARAAFAGLGELEAYIWVWFTWVCWGADSLQTKGWVPTPQKMLTHTWNGRFLTRTLLHSTLCSGMAKYTLKNNLAPWVPNNGQRQELGPRPICLRRCNLVVHLFGDICRVTQSCPMLWECF